MTRAQLWLWGGVAAVALRSMAAVARGAGVRWLGPSAQAYPHGQTLSGGASISLKGGDVVTLRGPSSAQTLRGPGNFETKQVALASAAGKRGRFGALRTAEVAHNPSIWDLDVTQSGKMCINKTGKLTLWRPDAETAANVKIRASDGKTQDLAWAAGKASAAWPAS